MRRFFPILACLGSLVFSLLPSRPVTGTDGTIYANDIAGHLTLVFTGGQENYGLPGFFAAVGARRGRLLWKMVLPRENDAPVVPFSRARFSRDGTQAYISAIISGVYDHSFLYAVTTS